MDIMEVVILRIKEIFDQDNTLLLSLNNGARILNDTINLGGLYYLKSMINEGEQHFYL